MHCCAAVNETATNATIQNPRIDFMVDTAKIGSQHGFSPVPFKKNGYDMACKAFRLQRRKLCIQLF